MNELAEEATAAAIEAVARELAIDQDHSRHCKTIDTDDVADCNCRVIEQTRRDADIAVTIATPILLAAERERIAQAIEAKISNFATVASWAQAAAIARGPGKRYIILGTKDEIRAWMQEYQISPNNVYTVTPGSRRGALRGLSGEFDILVGPGWAAASQELRDATEEDIRIIRATQPADRKEIAP